MLCNLWFRGRSEKPYKEKQTRLFPYLKHFVVHLLIIFYTDIRASYKPLLLFLCFFFFFHLDCIHVKCIYIWKKRP